MTRAELNKLYNDNWCLEYRNLLHLQKRIKELASLGAYTTHVRFSSSGELRYASQILIDMGFDVEMYNGTIDIIVISWG